MKKRRKFKKKSDLRKFIIAFFVITILGGGGMVYELYSRVYHPNIIFTKDTATKYIYIPTNSDFLQVVTILSENGLLINTNSFAWLAKQKKYDINIKPGRYKIDRALNNNELVNLLRSGKQTPIKVTFHNLRTKEELAGKIANQIEADSVSILECITDVMFQQKLGLNDDNVACVFLPNTYEFYWDTSAEEFVNRMLKEYSIFWNSSRKEKAENIKLNYYEVAILASIVEKEQSIKADERSVIAGLYLNRLKKGMKLQSDPTIIFAIGDFSIRRVLTKDLKMDSPYNT
ncbi:MAG: endolytic transglycosylase MltG, partial [Bacteroidota bacterium]|nr:endolytic transglycosylase MltG [Bacteroidota bacterium]